MVSLKTSQLKKVGAGPYSPTVIEVLPLGPKTRFLNRSPPRISAKIQKVREGIPIASGFIKNAVVSDNEARKFKYLNSIKSSIFHLNLFNSASKTLQ